MISDLWQLLEQNAVVIGAIAGLVAIAGAVVGMVIWLKRHVKPAPPQATPVQIVPDEGEAKLTIIDFIRIRRELRAEIIAERDRTDASERALLQARIDELTTQITNPEGAFEAERKRLADLEARLLREGNELGAERLQSAIDALRRGQPDEAEEIFTEIAAREELAVKRAARAEYGLGEIAESRVNWPAAARHYTRAADLSPDFDALYKARLLAWRMGDYPSALRHGTAMLSLARQGSNHTQLATALNEHALTLKATGRYEQAEPLTHEALEICRKALGDRHPDVATTLNNLANLLTDTGRTTEAEPLYREALEIDRATLGDRHPDVAIELNNLANLLTDTGRTTEAEPLYREALEIGRETLGDCHPDVATRLNNLASLLRATGRAAEAEPLFREALEIRRDTLGDRHPDVAASLNNLAFLLQATGRAAEAEPIHREALEISRETLGDRHPAVATDLNNLAALLQDADRTAEAEPLFREALEISREILGVRHPAVATRLNNLAFLLQATDRADQATPLFLEALGILRASLGDDHPDTRKIAANTLIHLRTHAPGHPDLPALGKTFAP